MKDESVLYVFKKSKLYQTLDGVLELLCWSLRRFQVLVRDLFCPLLVD